MTISLDSNLEPIPYGGLLASYFLFKQGACMVNNKFNGIIIPVTSDVLDSMSDLGVCGSGGGTVLIWSHVLEEGASEFLTNTLAQHLPDLFSTNEKGNLQYKDTEDTMLYFLL